MESTRSSTQRSHTYHAPSTPEQAAMLEKAKAYQGIRTPGMPPGWAFDTSGQLINETTGTSVASAEPNSAPGSSFGGQLLHALPYIGAAEGMGVLGGVLGGGSAAGEAAAGGGGLLSSTATAPMASMLPGGVATSAAVGGTAASGAGGAGILGNVANTARTATGMGSNLRTALSAAGAAAPILSMLHGQPSAGDDLSNLFQQVPELKQAIQLQQKQSERNDPLHQALTQLAMNFLPRQAFGALPGRSEVK